MRAVAAPGGGGVIENETAELLVVHGDGEVGWGRNGEAKLEVLSRADGVMNGCADAESAMDISHFYEVCDELYRYC